jgi:hypothetical protein
MFKVKKDIYYVKYYLFGIRVWKRQRTSKEVIEFIMDEMGKNCANMQGVLRKNAKKILSYVDEHYEAKKIVCKKKK